MKLVLASSSPSRKALLSRLRLDFETRAPAIDEQPAPDETIETYVERLAREKAEAVARDVSGALVIGADQACSLGGIIMGKPGTPEAAAKQLKMCSGTWLTFHTALALLNTDSGKVRTHVEPFSVQFRELGDEEIRAYIALDDPLACAGCFKLEQAGIALFQGMRGNDYTSLIGLPMITLVSFLRAEGFNPLLHATP